MRSSKSWNLAELEGSASHAGSKVDSSVGLTMAFFSSGVRIFLEMEGRLKCKPILAFPFCSTDGVDSVPVRKTCVTRKGSTVGLSGR